LTFEHARILKLAEPSKQLTRNRSEKVPNKHIQSRWQEYEEYEEFVEEHNTQRIEVYKGQAILWVDTIM
jgi:hypothetical protein